MTKLFQRPTRRKNTADAVGRVVVNVVLQNPKTRAHTTGNITRSFALDNTRVSSVAAVLESVLGRGV